MSAVISTVKLNNIRISWKKTSDVRFCRTLLNLNSSNSYWNRPQQRQYSFQNTIDSLVRTQTGIFKSLSESPPVEYTQKFLLYVHDSTGLPWWATIVCTTVCMRTALMLPVAVYQYYILAKLENLKLEMPAIVEEMKKEMAIAIKMYKWDERTAKITFNRSIRKQWSKLIERDNCHPFKTVILLFIQLPMWISLSISIRNLVYMLPTPSLDAQITFTELSVGGLGFIPNLTAMDSSYILPVALGIINLTIIEFQCLVRVDPPTRLAKILMNVFRGFSILMIPVAASVPSCLVLYWTTSSAYGLLQNFVLISPKIRRLCRIPKTPKELERPYEHVSQEFINKCNKIMGYK